jgi:hypothetical protein
MPREVERGYARGFMKSTHERRAFFIRGKRDCTATFADAKWPILFGGRQRNWIGWLRRRPRAIAFRHDFIGRLFPMALAERLVGLERVAIFAHPESETVLAGDQREIALGVASAARRRAAAVGFDDDRVGVGGRIEAYDLRGEPRHDAQKQFEEATDRFASDEYDRGFEHRSFPDRVFMQRVSPDCALLFQRRDLSAEGVADGFLRCHDFSLPNGVA